MTENLDIGDLTLKQLLQSYQDPASYGSASSHPQDEQKNTSSQNDIEKFSKVMNGASDKLSIDQNVNQNLAHIVDDLIKMIGSQS